ncbi:MAG TPA: outer membrane protein assembly factor BamD [Rhodospirillaceae bacterium]|nr:outer membrane protein assembly factor BamD [Rhodospirillaceae bacterium]HAA93294.1 outer membrane protein assembly factor BamD [Rhodospirillaceae bacterium]HAT35903.1 outer membrane protein assembly factor BamD [Rhodospirillaceae bacterium]
MTAKTTANFGVFSLTGRRLRFPLLILTFCFVAGCSDTMDSIFGKPEEEKYKVPRTVEQIYNDAMDQLHAGWYETAAEQFDEVERQYPYSAWATKSQLMAAYAQYLNNRYDEAIIALDRFIELHPGNRDVAYAHYLKSLSYYEQISDVGRDQKMTQLALKSLKEVVRRYPKTPYARDARIKIDLTTDHLAGKEMNIGRYYQQKGEYLAAINRFRRIIERYQTTSHTPEALHRLTECYLALGITDEAQMAAAVLGHNYPGNPWYKDSYALLEGKKLKPQKKDGSWLSWMWDWAL